MSIRELLPVRRHESSWHGPNGLARFRRVPRFRIRAGGGSKEVTAASAGAGSERSSHSKSQRTRLPIVRERGLSLGGSEAPSPSLTPQEGQVLDRVALFISGLTALIVAAERLLRTLARLHGQGRGSDLSNRAPEGGTPGTTANATGRASSQQQGRSRRGYLHRPPRQQS